jgi:hypothetical protein
MKYIVLCSLLLSGAILLQNCTDTPPKTVAAEASAQVQPVVQLDPGFNSYWFNGTAELTSYEVEQDRYGELRKAEQVCIFVTEDFSKEMHVKLDAPQDAGADRIPVLKLNWIRRFNTGVYDYSVMQSVFKPLDGTQALKTTTTIQDWCGHVFQQYNRTESGYKICSRSYFESEGDQEMILNNCWLEDELWVMLRLNPDAIPTGRINLVPSAIYHRFRHVEENAEKAEIQMTKGASESSLTVRYSNIPRTLTIRFESAFPHRILGWEELHNNAIMSKGVKKATWTGAYWAKNGNNFAFLRDSLMLKN